MIQLSSNSFANEYIGPGLPALLKPGLKNRGDPCALQRRKAAASQVSQLRPNLAHAAVARADLLRYLAFRAVRQQDR